MKKILMSSIALSLFSISLVVFQMSCQKSVSAQTSGYTLPPATNSTLGGVIVGTGLSVSSNGTLSVTAAGGLQQLNKILFRKNTPGNNIWMANYDGSSQTQINIAVPSGLYLTGEASLSPDGKTIFVGLADNSSHINYIYSCNTDGTNLKKIIDGTSAGTDGLNIIGAY